MNCISGCTRSRQHVTDCPNRDECRGCLPATAEHGMLCQHCHSNLYRDIATAPGLVGWLRQQVEPGTPGSDGKVRGTRTPPAPLSVDAVAAADDLHAALASWALLILEEHPGNLAGPEWTGSLVRPVAKRLVVAYHDELGYPAHLHYGPPAWSMTAYEPARVVGLRPDTAATANLCRWLLARTDWISEQEWAAEMVRELTGTTATLLARWPQEARARAITDLPCPGCDRLSLVYYPVTVAKGSVLVQCEHYDCGKRVDEDKWAWYARVIAEAKKIA